MKRLIAVALLQACTSAEPVGNAAAPAHTEVALTWDQAALGCAYMGEGEARHVMCVHGHSLSLHGEPLYERWLFLQGHGLKGSPDETVLMGSGPVPGTDASLPEPLTPILRARLGERVRLRVVSYGPLFHTFHVHGHVWLDDGAAKDVQTVGPAEVYDKAEFYAGGGPTEATLRAGTGDWMTHCHVEPHAVTGMWGLFRVLPKDATESLGADGRFAHEVPAPLGGPGQTVDVWVVAAEVPLAVARTYAPATKTLENIERLARLYVPIEDEATWLASTPTSIRKRMADKKESWTPWLLSLRLGTTVRLHLRNLMEEAPVTLHPHGVAYDKDSDGTMPMNVAKPGGQPVVSTWKADMPGTWPLHDHVKTLESVGRGLFAAIVVKTPDEEKVLQRDYVVFMHDLDMDWLMGAEDPQGVGH